MRDHAGAPAREREEEDVGLDGWADQRCVRVEGDDVRSGTETGLKIGLCALLVHARVVDAPLRV